MINEINYLVSIIIPVYNTEDVLFENCVNSVMKQSYQNLEIIIVNDGSNDQTYHVCNDYLEIDKRIKVIHISNSGVSVARNVGTAHALGQYIMYVDSDDILVEYAVQEAVDIAVKNNSDYVLGALQRITSHDGFNPKQTNIKGQVRNYYDKQIDVVRSALLTHRDKAFKNIDNNGYINRGPCARLIRMKIAVQEKFDENLTLGEDVEWNMRILRHCSIVTFVPKVWYGYLCYQGSSLRRYYGNRAERLEKYLLKLLHENEDYFGVHKAEYAINMAVAFHHMIVLDYLSPLNKASVLQKNKDIRAILNRYPWCLLMDKDYYVHLSRRYKLLISETQRGCGLYPIIIWQTIRGFRG